MRPQGRDCDVYVLDLGNNSMSDQATGAVARLLHGKRSLKELNLYMNDIGDHGMSKVCARGLWSTLGLGPRVLSGQ